MGHCVSFSGKQGAAPPSRIVPVRLWIEWMVTRKKLHRRVLQDFTFPIHILLQDLSLFGPSKACNILELMVRIEYNKSSANLQHCQRPCYSFFVIRRYGNE